MNSVTNFITKQIIKLFDISNLSDDKNGGEGGRERDREREGERGRERERERQTDRQRETESIPRPSIEPAAMNFGSGFGSQ